MIVQKVLQSLLDHFDAKVCAIEELEDLDSLSIDELHGFLTTYEMRSRNSTNKEATFKASKTSRKGKNHDCNGNDSDTEMARFVKKLKKGSKLKCKFPVISFRCSKIGHYATKCPFKDDSDAEDESKRTVNF